MSGSTEARSSKFSQALGRLLPCINPTPSKAETNQQDKTSQVGKVTPTPKEQDESHLPPQKPVTPHHTTLATTDNFAQEKAPDASGPSRIDHDSHPAEQGTSGKETANHEGDTEPPFDDELVLATQQGRSLENRIPQGLPADVRLTLAMFSEAVIAIGKEIVSLANEWEDGKYERRYLYASMGDSPDGPHPTLPKHVVSLPKEEAFSSKKIGNVVGRAHAFLRSQLPLVARLDEDPKVAFREVGYDVFKGFFGDEELFPMPRGILSSESDFWREDECFTNQFLNGCNPTVIEKPSSTDQVNKRMPKELYAVCDEYNRSVSELLKAGELYWADYEVLCSPGIAGAVDAESGAYTNTIYFDAAPKMTKYFYAPFVAFYKKKDNRLGILGIILTRSSKRKNFVYNARTCRSNPNIYTFAKMHVACADNQLHQFYYHLGRCHLTYEPFGVAVRNIFHFGSKIAQDHAVGQLLKPHFHDHMAINWLARNTLITHKDDAIAFTDAGFSLGSQGGLALLAVKYKHWKLQDQAFPQQLRSRGFDPDGQDGLEYYYYRTDGMRIWTALSSYVRSVIETFYEAVSEEQRDSKVAADTILDEWCSEMRDPKRAFVPSFPKKFTSVSSLCETITTIIYNVSAEHSAVNASQERYLSYVPNRPNSLFRPVPPPTAVKDMDLIREVLGIHRMGGNELGASMPISFAMFQVQFAQLLTLPATRTLMQLDDLKHDYPHAYESLMLDLEVAHYIIKARNIKLSIGSPHLPPYEFLDPRQIPLSIEI
eukprot:GFKZ01000137.1.p1 GENE.GFKZ01000137.1~~GFKZ01000137.1.p1  ORF type:complete len:769 (-),score=89.57 GFKZ01000137.1:2557-4863(-)